MGGAVSECEETWDEELLEIEGGRVLTEDAEAKVLTLLLDALARVEAEVAEVLYESLEVLLKFALS